MFARNVSIHLKFRHVSLQGAALLGFLISVKFRASSLVRGRLRLSFFLDDFQSAATTGLG